ncbi:MAG: winged helix-turn-helix domain-containing protein [Actinomycetia bacterium]|nr:winged helix-turn-helix domain-containing protein [Actinomycetes bacterium]
MENVLRLLGPLELIVEGHRIDIGGPNQRALLSYLALRDGELIPIPTIVAAVWGDRAPDGAVRSLRTYVSNLRRILGSAVEIRGERGMYVLTRAALETDINLFRRGVGDASDIDDPHGLASTLASALALWRGPLLADVDRPWVLEESAILDSQRINATARWAEAMIEDGEPESVIAQIDVLVEATPHDERLTGILMRALYLSGRQSDALAAYRRLRNTLAEELGLEPGPELKRLEEQILVHEVATGGKDQRNAFPAPTSDLVGRVAEIDDLMARTEDARLLTLTGPGGVGKTRLALEVGRRVDELGVQPVFFADLAAVQDRPAVLAVLAASVGVQAHPDVGPLVSMIEYLAPRPAMLVVDNCEHVSDTAAGALATLVRGCPKLTIIATSRSPLHVDGEFEWQTPSLAFPERSSARIDDLTSWPAIELLVQRAPNTFELTDDNSGDVVDLCRNLDGLPLAIEIAASRLGSMTPTEIIAALGSRLSLSPVDGTAESRHATLAATIGWSYELLPSQPRELFARLGVMSGRFLFEDVLAVCADEDEPHQVVRHQLSMLVERSLITAETTGTRTRYRLLETIRRFALDRLGDRDVRVRTRHAIHFAAVAEFETTRLLSDEEGDAIVEVSAAHDNLRGAFRWAISTGDFESASKIVVSLPDGAYWRSHNEVASWARELWEKLGSDDIRWRAVSGAAARGSWQEAQFEDAVRFARDAVDVEGKVPSMCGYPEDVLADIALYRGDAKTALVHYSAVAEIANRVGNRPRYVWATYYIAVVEAVLGRRAEASAAAARALSGARETGNPTSLAFSLYASGLAVKHLKPQEAGAMFEEATMMASSVANDWFSNLARMELASVATAYGDREAGFRDFASVVDYWHRIADDTQLRHTWRYMTRALSSVGLHEDAAVLAGALMADTDSTLGHPHHRVMESIVAGLDDAQFRRLSVRGSIMSVPELVAVSLDAIDKALVLVDAEPTE